MFFKRIAASLVVLAGASTPALAQVETGGLDAIDPWGLGYLDETEAALPKEFWRASSLGDLLPLMNRARTRNLTPAERVMLRQLVLSPAQKPDGDQAPELLAERARLMFELGEARAAADLMGRLEVSPVGFAAKEVAADLELALGLEATACDRGLTPPDDSDFWVKLKTVCLALQGAEAEATLAIELAESQGVSDTWLWSAVLAAIVDVPDKPEARFDTGLALAISAAAELEPDPNAAAKSRPDLAAAIAVREVFDAPIRVLAAGVAAENSLITGAQHLAVYDALFDDENFLPGTPIEAALAALRDPEAGPDDRARLLSAAIRSAQGNPARFAAVSRLLKTGVDGIRADSGLARYALGFARAYVAAGDVEAALAWTSVARGASNIDPFEVAWIEGLSVLARDTGASAGSDEVARRIVEAAGDDNRRAAAVKLLSLWTVFDIAAPAEGRALMAAQRGGDGDRISPWAILSIDAAAQDAAAAEAILRILTHTRGDPSDIGATEIAAMADALVVLNAQTAARLLTLEATGYWKASL